MKYKGTVTLGIIVAALCIADHFIQRRSAGLDRLDEAVPGYTIAGASQAYKMAEEAVRALVRAQVTFEPVKPHKSTSIWLMFVPADADLSKWKLSSLAVNFVEWRNMNWSSLPHYRGYIVIVSGRPVDGQKPGLTVGGVKVPLEHASPKSGSWTAADTRFPFYREEFSHRVPRAPNFDPRLGRTYLPNSVEVTGLVHAAGQPLYELDVYDHGAWRGSYVAWPTKQEAEAGHLIKS